MAYSQVSNENTPTAPHEIIRETPDSMARIVAFFGGQSYDHGINPITNLPSLKQ